LFTNIFTAITPFIGLTTIYSHAKNYLLDGERTGGFFANANEAGVFGNYLIVIYFIMFLKKEKRKWVLLPVLFLGLYNSFISFSKAAMLVAPIIIIYFIIFSFFKLNHLKRHNQKSIISVVFIFIILVFAIATNFDSIHGSLDLSKQRRIDNILLLASGQIDKKTTSKRSVLFEHGIRKISQKPLLGYGLGSFQQFNRGPIQLGVHNTFLLIAGESGIIPISLFILFLGTLFYKGYFFKEPEIGFFITAVIIVFIINLYGTNHSTIPDRPSNILIGAFLALLEKKK
jgi:O-antigen ligase